MKCKTMTHAQWVHSWKYLKLFQPTHWISYFNEIHRAPSWILLDGLALDQQLGDSND